MNTGTLGRPDAARSRTRATHDTRADGAQLRFEIVVLALYALLVSVVSAFHEPWKDETQAWRLAIDSHGLVELVRNARYEGHPLLFHLMLQGIGLISRSWWAAVVAHVIIACVGAWIVLRHSPFTRLQKVLLVFGYWSAYEYAVVVRPYGLGMVLGFAACAAWLAPRRRVAWTAVSLVLLANTTAMGTLLALALTAAFAFDWARPDDVSRRPDRSTIVRVGVAACVAALLVVYTAAAQIRPPADAGYKGEIVETVSRWHAAASPTVVLRALFPLVLANDGVQWNRWILKPDSKYELAMLLLLTLVMLGIGLIVASRRRVALLFYVVGTGGYTVFFGALFAGVAHHHGYLFIVWVLSAWLAWGAPASDRPPLLRRVTEGVERMRGNLFVVTLVVPVLATVELAIADLLSPFSDAMHVADVIRARGLLDVPTIAIVRSHAQSVSAFTDRPVLFPLEGKSRTFVYWGTGAPYAATVRAADSATTALLTRYCRVVLIASPSQDIAPQTAARAHLVYTTRHRPMSGDRYRVWVAAAPESPRCPATRYPSNPPRSTAQSNPSS